MTRLIPWYSGWNKAKMSRQLLSQRPRRKNQRLFIESGFLATRMLGMIVWKSIFRNDVKILSCIICVTYQIISCFSSLTSIKANDNVGPPIKIASELNADASFHIAIDFSQATIIISCMTVIVIQNK